MKLFYIANNKIPTTHAHGIQIAKMCDAFARAGADVTLLVPRRRDAGQDAFATYGMQRSFEIKYLPVLHLPLWLPGAFALLTLSFARSAARFLERSEGEAVVYTRGEIPLFLTRLPKRFKLVWETHIKPEHAGRYAVVAERAVALIATTRHYAEEIPRLWHTQESKVYYAPDGVDLNAFTKLPSQQDARKALNLPLEKKIVLYTGSDLPWKGLILLRSASELLPAGVLTVFVGPVKEEGSPSAKRFFAGVQPYTRIPLWLAAADVLVLTGNPTSDTARYYTSPLKLFEYMASERPIIATDLPATRDILSEQEAYIAAPTSEGLAEQIEDALAHPEEATVRALRAREAVTAYSWVARARGILAHITTIS